MLPARTQAAGLSGRLAEKLLRHDLIVIESSQAHALRACIYLEEPKRSRRPTIGILPGLALGSILNTNSLAIQAYAIETARSEISAPSRKVIELTMH